MTEGEIPGHLLTVSCSDAVFAEVVRVVFENKGRVGRIAVYSNIDYQLSQLEEHFKSDRLLHRPVPYRVIKKISHHVKEKIATILLKNIFYI